MASTIPTQADLDRIERDYQAMKASRKAARTLAADAQNRRTMASQAAERTRFASPALLAEVVEAKRVLGLAEQARDALVPGLRERYADQARHARDLAARNKVEAPARYLDLNGTTVDMLAAYVIEDPRYVEAEALVSEARSAVRRAERAAGRSAAQRQYARGQLEREARLEARQPDLRSRLEQLAGGRSSLALRLETERLGDRLGGAA